MAEADKLNIDSIIQRLLEGKTVVFFIHRVAILANRLDNANHLFCLSKFS